MYCDEMERSIHDALCVVKVCINLFLYMAYTKQTDVYYSNLILANHRESLSQSLWSSGGVVLKLPSPSTLRTLRPLFHPGGFYHVILDLKYKTYLLFREQLAIADFAKSLLVIPKTLAVNAAKDSADLVAKLRAYHNSSQTKKEHEQLKNCGLDLYEGVVRDNKKAGVFEPAISKIKSLKFATEAAITILRIDDMIKLQPEKGEEKSYQQAYADGSLNG